MPTVKWNEAERLQQALAQGDVQVAKHMAIKIETTLPTVQDINEKFLLLNALAKYYRKTKNYDKAGDFGRQAIRLSQQVSDEHINVIIDTFLDYAKLERAYGQFATARLELAKLLELLDKRNVHDQFAYGLIFSLLGKIAMDEENFEMGLHQLEKGLTYFKKVVPITHPKVLSTIDAQSNAYVQVENYEAALK